MWISNDARFLLEAMKSVASRLLKGLPHYQLNSNLLDASMTTDGEIKPVELVSMMVSVMLIISVILVLWYFLQWITLIIFLCHYDSTCLKAFQLIFTFV